MGKLFGNGAIIPQKIIIEQDNAMYKAVDFWLSISVIQINDDGKIY